MVPAAVGGDADIELLGYRLTQFLESPVVRGSLARARGTAGMCVLIIHHAFSLA